MQLYRQCRVPTEQCDEIVQQAELDRHRRQTDPQGATQLVCLGQQRQLRFADRMQDGFGMRMKLPATFREHQHAAAAVYQAHTQIALKIG